jgi:hypothetical protein
VTGKRLSREAKALFKSYETRTKGKAQFITDTVRRAILAEETFTSIMVFANATKPDDKMLAEGTRHLIGLYIELKDHLEL